MTSATTELRPFCMPTASGFAEYASDSAAACTRARVCGATRLLRFSFRARDTVAGETPANAATSLIPARLANVTMSLRQPRQAATAAEGRPHTAGPADGTALSPNLLRR